jgi:hypothetical protein
MSPPPVVTGASSYLSLVYLLYFFVLEIITPLSVLQMIFLLPHSLNGVIRN